MKTQITVPKVFMKTKTLQVATAIATVLAFSDNVNAQNTSYQADAVPVAGIHNCALGAGAFANTTSSSYEGTAVGIFSLLNNTTGGQNTALGYRSLYANSTGNDNVGIGHSTFASNTTGSYNVALGVGAGGQSTTGNDNIGIGYSAYAGASAGSATGSQNVAIGSNALAYNLTGANNVAVGFTALTVNTTGSNNVASGLGALQANTTGFQNVAYGTYALPSNISGNYNSAVGQQALSFNTSANFNVSMGFKSMYSNTTGDGNIGIGSYGLYYNTTGTYNTAIGYTASPSVGNLTNSTAIGANATVNASNKVRIGSTTVTVVEGPVAYTFSDGRFKTNIKEDDVKGLEFIAKLRPVVYNLDTKKVTEFWTKNMPDSMRKQYMSQDFTPSTNIRQSGFIAQEVATAAKSVNYDFNGVHIAANDDDNYSIAYSEFVVPLVKGMQEQQKMIEDQKKMIDDLQQQINDLQKGQGSTTGINQISMAGSYMDQNVPNPFSTQTVISFSIAGQFSNAYMAVYDLSGKQLKTIPITQHGASSITITSDQLAAGMYIYSIMVDGKLLDSKRMVVEGK